jgi:hypothetical protein
MLEGGDFVFEATSPVILVDTTEAIESIYGKKNLSFIEFITPFGQRLEPIKTLQIAKPFVRFTTNEHKKLNTFQIMKTVLGTFEGDEFKLPSKLNDEIPLITPWHYFYRSLITQVHQSDHDTFNEHILTLFVLTPNDSLDSIKNCKQQKLCLVIFNGDEDITFVANLKQICPTYFINLKNSIPKNKHDLWADVIARSQILDNTTERPKIDISQEDVFNFDTFINQFLSPFIYNFISAQIQEWERAIFSQRRGISNRLFKVGLKYFGNQPPEPSTTVNENGETVFRSKSPEMVIRRLADYSFMIRDFKYAQSAYENIKKDFSASQKFTKYYAGVQVIKIN